MTLAGYRRSGLEHVTTHYHQRKEPSMTYISDKPTWELQREIDTLTAELAHYKGRSTQQTVPVLSWHEFTQQMGENGVLLVTEPHFDLHPVIRTELGDHGIAACHTEAGHLVIDLGHPLQVR